MVLAIGVFLVNRDDYSLISAIFLIDSDGAAHVACLVVEGVPLAEHFADLRLGESRRGEKKK